jgi:DNA repair exonuclease SbcCD ATPase subunit
MLGGKSLRTTKAVDVLNINKNHFHCELCFKLQSGKKYYIKKLGKRQQGADGKDSVKVYADFWTYDESEQLISLNGDDRRSTDDNIQDYVGSIDNLILTAISLQNNFFGLIDKSQTERKIILSSFLGIDIFEELYNLGNEKSRDLLVLIKEFSKKNYDEELSDIERNLGIQRKLLTQTSSKLKQFELDKEEKTQKIINLSKQLSKIETAKDIDELKQKKKTIVNEQKVIESTIDEIKTKINKLLGLAKQLAENLKSYDELELNVGIEKLTILEQKKNKLDIELRDLNTEIKHQKDKLKNLDTLEYDPKCKFCMNNVFVKDAIKTKKTYAESLVNLQKVNENINSLTTSIDNNI